MSSTTSSPIPPLIRAKFAPVKAAFGISDQYIDRVAECNDDLCGDLDENGEEVPRYTVYVRVKLNDNNRDFLAEDDDDFWTFEDRSEDRPGPNGTTFYLERFEKIYLTLGNETTYGFMVDLSNGWDVIDFGYEMTAAEHLEIRNWFDPKLGNTRFTAVDYDGTDLSQNTTDNEEENE